MIHFYFDFLSPYAYLAHCRLQRTDLHGRKLAYHPVDLAWIKLRAGNTGPSTREMPLKLAYARTDLQRWAKQYGVQLIPLRSYTSDRINRGTFFAVDRKMEADYVRSAWQTVYGLGRDMSSDETLTDIALSLAWDSRAFLAFVESNEARARLEKSNVDAHEEGVFGVPTMICGKNMWWGNDRIDSMLSHIE